MKTLWVDTYYKNLVRWVLFLFFKWEKCALVVGKAEVELVFLEKASRSRSSEPFSKPRVKIEVPENSLKRENEYWNTFKKDSLDKRKLRTYTSIDSLSLSEKIEHKVFLGRKIINGYFPVSIFDIDLKIIFVV